ncbi:PemK-like, MazF-like toxin of type II toxin-antitoxin system [Actinocorallia herbida]|uniref:PemK-like, MazF-like toxin of type II toxin-antitoxin system n=1 Tax=Actinocorallia herbida TaxID=58109 RepID=A0A3N1DAN7_9ACTN|nr:type II toxin-antitoxin system PemK/MazF family toxin [Actinocorallia herbida]ROO90574.1 PemK-like, MazF-like toxin of type II toxin-antitoxin system [Actinocorallia herbida]
MKILRVAMLVVVVLCVVGIIVTGDVSGGLTSLFLLLFLVGLVYAVVEKVSGTASERRRGHPEPGAEGPRPGQVWWADIPYEDSRASKDRPCLVLDVTGRRVTALKITSKDRSGRADCLRLPAGIIDDPTGANRDSWLELREQRTFDAGRMRRHAGAVPARIWSRVRRVHPA